MSSSYAGNPAAFATTITIPDDGDPKNAASVNIPFEVLADRTAYLFNSGLYKSYYTALASNFTHTWAFGDPNATVDVTGLTVSVLNTVPGDILCIDQDVAWFGTDATSTCYLPVVVVDGATTKTFGGDARPVALTGATKDKHTSAIYTVVTGGTVVVKGGAFVSNGTITVQGTVATLSGVGTTANSSIRVMHTRNRT